MNGADGITYRDEFTRQLFLDCGLRVENMTVGGDSVILMNTDLAIFVPINTIPPDDDRLVKRLIMANARHGNHALIVNEEIDPRLAAAVYGHCCASLVSRAHGCIMSVKANCPVVMYAFDGNTLA